MMDQKYGANVKAILALIFSILSVVCCCIWYVSLLLGIAAIVLGILTVRGENPGQKDLGIAGIVVGSVGVALAVSIVVIYIVMHGSAASDGVTGAWNAISRLG